MQALTFIVVYNVDEKCITISNVTFEKWQFQCFYFFSLRSFANSPGKILLLLDLKSKTIHYRFWNAKVSVFRAVYPIVKSSVDRDSARTSVISSLDVVDYLHVCLFVFCFLRSINKFTIDWMNDQRIDLQRNVNKKTNTDIVGIRIETLKLHCFTVLSSYCEQTVLPKNDAHSSNCDEQISWNGRYF